MADCLFLGGPLDGQWIEYDRDYYQCTEFNNHRVPAAVSPGSFPVQRFPERYVTYQGHTMQREGVILGRLFLLTGMEPSLQEIEAFEAAWDEKQNKAKEPIGDYNADEYNVAADFLEERDFIGPATALRQLAMGRLVRGCEPLGKEEQQHIALKLLKPQSKAEFKEVVRELVAEEMGFPVHPS